MLTASVTNYDYILMMMNCFLGMVYVPAAESSISRRDHRQHDEVEINPGSLKQQLGVLPFHHGILLVFDLLHEQIQIYFFPQK